MVVTKQVIPRNRIGLEDYIKNNLSGQTLLEIESGGGQWSKFISENTALQKIYC